jgi:hypothetical protein
MFEAMTAMTDAVCGEEPPTIYVGPGARKVRENRKLMMDALHKLVHLAMREGAARAMNPVQTKSGRIEIPY